MPSPTELSHPRPVWKMEAHPKLIGMRQPAPLSQIPALGIFRWHDNGDGTFTPIAEIHDAWSRIGAWLRPAQVEELPLGGLSIEVARKLIDAGFIHGCAPAPSLTLVNVTSLLLHLEEHGCDPNQWTRELRLRYATGLQPAPWTRERRAFVPAERGKVRALGVLTWQVGRHGYQPEMMVQDAFMRVSEVERLPLGISAEVLFRLVRGQFVRGTAAAPASTFVDVWDLLDHYEQTSGPNATAFWDEERRARYAATESRDEAALMEAAALRSLQAEQS
ncbi:MAG: hypothetical protein HS117_19295 [Verrucomicrobiaceae bacterium]|nr:hypothetical protein [Verrucomicrobiaceae bacterium]